LPAKLPWTRRRFTFDFPVLVYPDVIERVRGTPGRVEDRLRNSDALVLTRRDGNTWSIQENVGHLLDLEPMDTGRLDDFLSGVPCLRAADMTNRRTHDARHNTQPLESLLKRFRAGREALVARLESLDEGDFGRTALHPRLQVPMRLVDWLTFVAAHDDYHLARISELLRLFRA
jgi:uncharacterized damage-inducible protein DinB